MLNLSRIQLELEKAKEGLREVEETIQKVEGKAFSNGPGSRYSGLKVELHSDKGRNLQSIDDGKNVRRRVVTNSDSRNQRISADDLSYTLKRGPRDKRDGGPPAKRQPQSIFARLSGIVRPKPAEDEDDDDFQHKKPALSSRVITTSAEAPSRQEVIAAQTADEKSKQRNKRMFSALVGTLQKFRKEETRVREREEKRMKVEKKLEEDAKREREKLMQEKRELFLERKRREVEIKRIEWSLNRVKEYEAWEANVLPLKNFIQTQAKPHIFYLPRSHNHKTEEKLAQSQKIVERMIEKRKTNLKEEIENSERKARRTVAEATEEAEEEEAENIPQDDDHQVVEQQMEIDFDAMDKENGYHEDGPKENLENLENAAEQDETMNESINEEKLEQDDSKPEEELQEAVTTQMEEVKISETNDDEGGGQIADDGGGHEEMKTENGTKPESDLTIPTAEVPISDESETKNVENQPEDTNLVTENPKPEEINLPNEEPNISEDKSNAEAAEAKKESEESRRGNRSRSRKGTKRSRSSRSPRRSRSRTPRSRRRSRKSRSRSRRKTMRRRSKSVSVSPPKKSRSGGRRRSDRKRSNSKSPSPKRQTKSRASSSSSKSHSN